MGGEPVRLGDLCDLIERGLVPDRAAADIGRLFDADHGLRRLVARARMQRGAKGFRRKLPVGALQRRDLKSAERGMRAAFARDDMRGLMRQNLVAGTAPGQRRRDIAHGARRHEHRGLLIADFRPRHRLAHAGCRAGLGVGQQVDPNGRRLGIS